jgi:hypothetical protein
VKFHLIKRRNGFNAVKSLRCAARKRQTLEKDEVFGCLQAVVSLTEDCDLP